jgi:hypothetical protein
MAKPKKPAPFEFKIAPAAACVQKEITIQRKLPSGKVEPVTFMATRKRKGSGVPGKCPTSAKVIKARTNFREAFDSCVGEVQSVEKTFTPKFHTCMKDALAPPIAAEPKKPRAAKPKKPRAKKAK